MTVFTQAEEAYLTSQRLARLATASANGEPDVSAVGFRLQGDQLVSGGIDLTKTVRYRHLRQNPRVSLVVDDLASVEPWKPRGLKVRGSAVLEEVDGSLQIRITPEVVWSWNLNEGAAKRFISIERRSVASG